MHRLIAMNRKQNTRFRAEPGHRILSLRHGRMPRVTKDPLLSLRRNLLFTSSVRTNETGGSYIVPTAHPFICELRKGRTEQKDPQGIPAIP
jgi:hypothetical protein